MSLLITTCASIQLADVFNECSYAYPTVVINRTTLIGELQGLEVAENAWLFTFDIKCLYLQVKHKGCTDIWPCAETIGQRHKFYIMAVQEFLSMFNKQRCIFARQALSALSWWCHVIVGSAHWAPTACHLQPSFIWLGSARVLQRRSGKPLAPCSRGECFLDDVYVTAASKACSALQRCWSH